MVEIRNSYAIIIGINQYTEPNWKLRTAVNDACELTEILKDRYQYEVLQLLDEQAIGEKLEHLLTAFENQTIPFHYGSKKVEPDDRVLFYFAGHGIAVRDEKDDSPQGFIYPQDAIRGDNSSLLPMRELHDALVKLGCRHLLIILDCCFAGSFRWVTRQAELSEEEMYLERYNHYIAGYAQEVITSAAYNETAADFLYGFGERGEDDQNSPFAKALLEALNPKNEKNADFNKDGVITITEIIKYIEDKFLDLNAGQTPGYCQLKKHDFGKYIFVIPGLDAASNLKTAPLPDEKDPTYPYKGLLSFEENDQDKFFGRERLRKKLAEKVKEEPLTVVLGASGSGKSSLVKAGLIPDLKSTHSELEILAPIRPGESPLTALARVCKDIENPATQSSKTEFYREKLHEADYFANTVGNWSLIHLNQKLLLVIDQFEELVTLCRDDSERLKFLQQLAEAIVNYPEQLRIVVTLRSDYEPLISSLFKSQLQNNSQIDWAKARLEVSPMTREELRAAIVEPAEKIALFFEEKIQDSESSLVNQLIDEVINMPGGLPLLSFTLSELYRKFYNNVQIYEQYNRVITHKDYQELGRVTGSLTKRADEIYDQLKSKDKDYEKIIKHVMLRMVAESSGDLARRRVFMTELEYPQPFQQQVDEVIKEFTQARLLVKGRDEKENEYVEPAHDALIRGWGKLRKWLEPMREQEIAIQRRLTPAAEEWNRKKPGNFHLFTHPLIWLKNFRQRNKQAQYLWDANPYLDVLKNILNSSDNWYNQVETEFVLRSIQKRRNNQWLRRGLIAVAFTVGSGFAFIQWCQSRNAQVGRLAALSEASFNSNRQLEALIQSLKAGKQLQLPIGIEDDTKLQTMTALQQAVYSVSERNRLLGHKNTIRNISFSPNGQMIASASVDNTIKLWDLEGNLINTLKGHEGLVNSVSFSPNGKMLASASFDKTIKLWSINGKLLDNKQKEHKAEVYSVSFSPDGKMLVSASWDGTIKLWSSSDRTLKLIKTVELPPEILAAMKKDSGTNTPKPYSFHGVSFSPDGKLIAAGNEDKKVRIWNREGKLIKTLSGHSDRVYGVSFSPNGKMLATFSADSTIILWNFLDGKQKTLNGHKSDVYSTSFSSDGKMLISASNDNTIKFWDIEDGKELKTLAGHSSGVRSVNISPDGKMLASGSIDSTIKLWSVDGEDAIALTNHRKKVYSTSISPNNHTVATAGSDFTSTKNGKLYEIKLWRLDGKILRTLVGHESEIISTSFSPDGQILASGDTNGNIILWNPINGKIINKTQKAHQQNIRGLSFSPDGKILASASHDKTIKLWNQEGKLLTTLPKQENQVLSISFSPDSKMLASGSTRIIRLWNLEQRKLINTLKGHEGLVSSLSFSPKGKILASGSDAKTVKIWSIPDGKRLYTLRGHGEGINSISFHPHLEILASASDDRTVRLWNTKEGKAISILKGHSAPVYDVSFSRDGKTLASASGDSTALLWNTELLDLNTTLARGCKRV